MNSFEIAMTELLNGKRVRLKCWREGAFIYAITDEDDDFGDNGIYTQDDNLVSPLLFARCFSDDWEVLP